MYTAKESGAVEEPKKLLLKPYAESIVDRFEDYLESKGIIIPNDDRDMGNDAPLYGDDYAYIFSEVMKIFQDLANNISPDTVIDAESWR